MDFNLNGADFFVIGLIAFSTILAIYRGFVREILTIISWFIAGWLASIFGKNTGELFVFSDSEIIKQILGVAVVFFASIFAAAGLKFLVFKAYAISGPTRLDRFVGSVFGIARGVFVVMIILFIAPANTLKQSWYTDSVLLPKIHVAANVVAQATPESWSKNIHSLHV